MPHSHHSHSGQFCKHAVGTLEDVVLEAMRKGFLVYGLTEHVPRYREQDLYPEEAELSLQYLSEQFKLFLDEAHRLKSKYSPHISLLVGLETDFISGVDMDRLEALLKEYGHYIDYVVGSIHHANEIPIDFDNRTFQKALDSFGCSDIHSAQNTLLSHYFEAQFQLLQRVHPEIIGHFDLCRLYNPDLKFSDFPSIVPLIERNIAYAISYGALFELNAAAFRKKWSTAYPARDVVELILKHGGRFVLSDDSHGPHAVGLNYHLISNYARSVGVNELWFLQNSETEPIGERMVRAVRLPGDWRDHEFWTTLGEDTK